MVTTRIALISLRFKPAFVSHLVAFAKAFLELGCRVEFVLDPAYMCFAELGAVADVFASSNLVLDRSYTHAVFLNVSMQNKMVASHLKERGTRIFYVYHEPWQASLNYFRTEGIRGGITGALAHRVSVPMLRLADTVILPSQYGAKVYSSGDVRHNRRAQYLPLLFDDEADNRTHHDGGAKNCFSYIGTICRAHGFDQFVSFMRQSFLRKTNVKFMVASRVALPRYVLTDGVIRNNLDNIAIRCGRPLTNQEINRCYAESFCVWNLYRRSTQSGVLPKAFMFSTAVIANQIGAFPEFIKEGFNGRFAVAHDYCSIEAAVSEIQRNANSYAVNCRQTFLNTFFYRSNLSGLQCLLENTANTPSYP